jgi:opacity protein-like surface antigen
MKKTLAAIAIASAIATPAFAADTGMYIGGQIGQSKYGWSDTPNSATSGGIFAGFKFNQNIAMEGAYTSFGSVNSNIVPAASVKSNALSLSAVLSAPLSDSFSIYGKLGVASVKSDGAYLGANVVGTSKTGVTAGAGVQFNINQSAGIRLGYDSYQSALGAGTANIQDLNLGVVLNF